MRDDLSGPIATEANTPAPTRTDTDRREAQLVETFVTDPAKAQQMLDQRNQMEGAQEVVQREAEVGADPEPLPPAGVAAHIEDSHARNAALHLQRVSPAGEALVREWGVGFAVELGHAQSGLERLRQDMPALSDMVDRLPAAVQNALAPEILRFTAAFNRRYLGFNEPAGPASAPSYSAPSPAPAPSYRGAPQMPRDASMELAIEKLTGEAIGLHQAGRKMEAQMKFAERDRLIERRPSGRGQQEQTKARAFGRGV